MLSHDDNKNTIFHYAPSADDIHKVQKKDQADILIFPKCIDYKEDDLKFKEFVPKDNLYYCFFAETYKPDQNKINSKYHSLYKIKICKDIQRFRYYPNTHRIYTFIGFSNMDDLNKSIQKKSLKSSVLNKSVFLYPFKPQITVTRDTKHDKNNQATNSNILVLKTAEPSASYQADQLKTNTKSKKNSKFYYEPPSTSINNTNEEHKTHIKFNNHLKIQISNSVFNHSPSSASINIQVPKKKQINIITLPKFIHYKEDDLKFKEFVPKNNLYYCFFAEICEPNEKLLNKKNDSLYGIHIFKDIQRFCYYPNTQRIYTFIGFSSMNDLNQSIRESSLKLSALCQSVFLYPFKSSVPPLSSSNNNSKFMKAKSASIFYYAPTDENNKKMEKNNNKEIEEFLFSLDDYDYDDDDDDDENDILKNKHNDHDFEYDDDDDDYDDNEIKEEESSILHNEKVSPIYKMH